MTPHGGVVTYNRVRVDDSCDDVGGEYGLGCGGGEDNKYGGKGGDIGGINVSSDDDTEIEYITQLKSTHNFTVVVV